MSDMKTLFHAKYIKYVNDRTTKNSNEKNYL